MKFKAFAVANEIGLNQIAIQCGIPKKYTWEEPLIFTPRLLNDILKSNKMEDKKALVFAFGSVVTINFTQDEIDLLLGYLKQFEKEIDPKTKTKYWDEYELKVDESKKHFSFSDEMVIVPSIEIAYPELIATVIAKSVALEKNEEKITKILDNIENMVERLEKGKMRISDKELAKTISSVLRHEYNTIAYIMILDKPDITWENSECGVLYDKMSDFFELNDRYETIKTKTGILNDIIDGFATISHSMRGMFVEWLIVLLIVAEIVLMVLDLLR